MGTKKVTLISMAEFGEMCGGITGQAISNASKSGKVYRDNKTKKINPNHPTNLKYQNENSRQRDKATGNEQQEEAKDLSGQPLENLSETELKRLKLAGQVKAIDLKYDIERGKYVERSTVKNLFQAVEDIHNKALMNIGVRSSSAILSKLEADGTHKSYIESEIDGEAWKVRKQIKDLLREYINDQ